jgi:prepilin-type N-terminal cleavage/methylation domain-containing protein
MVKQQKGFTIIELVVVIVILGILAAVAFPKFQDLSGDAKKAVAQGGAAAISSAAVISFAKNQGAKQSLANIIAQTTMDTKITTDGTCGAVVVGYEGTNSATAFSITDYCS